MKSVVGSVLVLILALAITVESRHIRKRRDTTDIDCSEDDNETLYPHPTDCTQYIKCDNGEAVERPCAPGTEFSPTEQVCVFPEDSGCTASEDDEDEDDVDYSDDSDEDSVEESDEDKSDDDSDEESDEDESDEDSDEESDEDESDEDSDEESDEDEKEVPEVTTRPSNTTTALPTTVSEPGSTSDSAPGSDLTLPPGGNQTSAPGGNQTTSAVTDAPVVSTTIVEEPSNNTTEGIEQPPTTLAPERPDTIGPGSSPPAPSGTTDVTTEGASTAGDTSAVPTDASTEGATTETTGAVPEGTAPEATSETSVTDVSTGVPSSTIADVSSTVGSEGESITVCAVLNSIPVEAIIGQEAADELQAAIARCFTQQSRVLIPVASECSKYIECDGGQFTIQTCEDGESFDGTTAQCVSGNSCTILS